MDDPFQLSDETQTMERLRERTRELAALKGRAAHEVTQEDYEAAKRDLAANPQPWIPRKVALTVAATNAGDSVSPSLAPAYGLG